MVYCRDGKNAVRGVIKESGTATTATTATIFITFQLIVFHAGNAQFPHLLVLADGCLRKPSFPDKKDPEGQSQESYTQKDDRNDNDFQHNVCKVSILI
jgi:hypothetical protein